MIEKSKILQTDLLDILFDDRNKQYGAYELRKHYNKRILVAVITTVLSCLLLLLLYSFTSKKKSTLPPIIGPIVKLAKLRPDEPKPEQPPPPPKEKIRPIKTKMFTAPIITNNAVKPDEQPPKMDDLDNAKIGKVNVDGDDYTDIVAPPISDKPGVIDIPKKQDAEEDGIVVHVQIESEYPGGLESWRRFLNKILRYPESAVENGIQGTVIVQFIVDKEGAVSEVEAVSGPNELRDEAIRVIKKSGQWNPAIQNGRKVKSYKKQPITFVLEQ